MDKYEMIKKIITLLNETTVCGVRNVLSLANVFQMVNTLQKGLKDEDDAKNKTIEMLKEQLKRATEPVEPEPGGDVVGGEYYELKFGGGNNGGD